MSDPVLIALIAAIASMVSAVVSSVAVVRIRQTHDLVNSRMTELLEVARGRSRAEGVIAGEQAERDRRSPPTDA